MARVGAGDRVDDPLDVDHAAIAAFVQVFVGGTGLLAERRVDSKLYIRFVDVEVSVQVAT